MTLADPRPATKGRYRVKRKYRHCAVCGVALEARPVEHYIFAIGNDTMFHNRLWFCDEHGAQIQAAVLCLKDGAS